MTQEEFQKKVEETIEYNEKISKDGIDGENNSYPIDAFTDNSSFADSTEDVDKKPFAYIEIPRLDEFLPIYLGATEQNLYDGVAHIEGTSMPTGGVDTHSVIAGHRGYSQSRFFRYIDQIEEGDQFYIYVLGNKLSYKVVSQMIIAPDDVGNLRIQQGKDLVSLLSCHPYPYMSHRIVVTGMRINNDSSESDLNSDIEYKNEITKGMVEEVWKQNNSNIESADYENSPNYDVKNQNVSMKSNSDENKQEDNSESNPGNYQEIHDGNNYETSDFIVTEKVDIKSVKKKNYIAIGTGLIIILLCVVKLIKVIKEDIL